jgi:hypothetical protein
LFDPHEPATGWWLSVDSITTKSGSVYKILPQEDKGVTISYLCPTWLDELPDGDRLAAVVYNGPEIPGSKPDQTVVANTTAIRSVVVKGAILDDEHRFGVYPKATVKCDPTGRITDEQGNVAAGFKTRNTYYHFDESTSDYVAEKGRRIRLASVVRATRFGFSFGLQSAAPDAPHSTTAVEYVEFAGGRKVTPRQETGTEPAPRVEPETPKRRNMFGKLRNCLSLNR